MGTETTPEVVEDVFEGRPTDVEVEDANATNEETQESQRPWNPDQIRVTTSAFSLRNILDQIEEHSLELAPDFQRGRVWNVGQKSRLVESVLLQIPLPAFYFAEDSDGAFHVVDGLQRLSTLYAYVRDPHSAFPLRGLEYLDDIEGKHFADLSIQWQRRILNTQLIVNVIDPSTPSNAMYDIFKRLNTGGTPLNAQEIRHSMSRPRSRNILKRMTHTDAFTIATNGLTDHIRMSDREMALRFAAFSLLGLNGYLEQPAMEPFLMHATRMLDDPRQVPDERVAELERSFTTAMENAYLLFGEHAFRKWPLGAVGRSPINRALFETWSVALADREPQDLVHRRAAIVEAARDRMANDIDYLNAITSSTADRRRVSYRFEAAAADVEAGK